MTQDNEEKIYEDEVNLLDLIRVLWRRKLLIALIVVLCTAGGAYYSFSKKTFNTVAKVELNFPGIQKHQSPDKSKFELYDLISPDVITAADLANIGEGEQ